MLFFSCFIFLFPTASILNKIDKVSVFFKASKLFISFASVVFSLKYSRGNFPSIVLFPRSIPNIFNK